MPENYYKNFCANILCAFLQQRMMLVFRCKKRRNEGELCIKILYKQHENMSNIRKIMNQSENKKFILTQTSKLSSF
jgi:hypothetical protein